MEMSSFEEAAKMEVGGRKNLIPEESREEASIKRMREASPRNF
jgi:hypothetical protein